MLFLSTLTSRATHAQHTRTPLHPAALASVPYGIVLVRVRVRDAVYSYVAHQRAFIASACSPCFFTPCC